MADVVVVGAGIGGLTAAIALAARGRDVLVFEAADGPGGKAGIAEIDGVEVDTGPSLLTLPGVFDAVLREANTSLADEVTLRRPDPAFRYLYPDDVQLDIHHEPDATLASVASTLGVAAEAELSRFLAYARRVWEAAAPSFVFGGAPSVWSLLWGGPSKWRAATRIDPFRSMKAGIDAQVKSPHLRQLLYRYATYNGSDVRSAPATLNCIAHVELSAGGFALEGGMYALVRALVRVAQRLGVELRYEAPVERIELADGRAAAVYLEDGARISVNAVVANTDAAHLVHHLLPGTARTGIRLQGTPSMSAHNAILRAKRGSSNPRVAHTVVFPSQYIGEFEDIFDRRRLPAEPTIYACAQRVCHGRGAWPDAEPLFLMVNAPGGAEALEEEAAAGELAPPWNAVHARLVGKGLAQPSDSLVWRRSPEDLASRFPGSGGSLYGAASNDRFAAFRRPPNAISKVPGLYLASGTAHPGGGVPLAACSGRQAAAAICRDSGYTARELR